MIALAHSEKQAFLEVFPEQFLKLTPDPEFLSNLYGFDMSLCLLPSRQRSENYISEIFRKIFVFNSESRALCLLPSKKLSLHASYITEIFTENFDAINSASRVPELIVWMQSQVCPTIIVPFILNDFHYTCIETP